VGRQVGGTLSAVHSLTHQPHPNRHHPRVIHGPSQHDSAVSTHPACTDIAIHSRKYRRGEVVGAARTSRVPNSARGKPQPKHTANGRPCSVGDGCPHHQPPARGRPPTHPGACTHIIQACTEDSQAAGNRWMPPASARDDMTLPTSKPTNHFESAAVDGSSLLAARDVCLA
jgi:hypothetical protein